MNGYALIKNKEKLLKLMGDVKKKGNEFQKIIENCLIKIYESTIYFSGECKNIIERLIEEDVLIIGENRERWGGIDEAGKGENKGPLVVAGVIVDKKDITNLIISGVRDSKKLKEKRIIDIGTKIKKYLIYEVEILTPEQYNIQYEKEKNINKIIKKMVEKVIDKLKNYKPEIIIVDDFSKKNIPERENIKMVEKADSKDLAVMSASIIAKYEYIEWLKKNKNKKGKNLYKLHFKNTQI